LKYNLKISVVILTYNRCHMVKELVNSLMQLEYKNLEIIVVDNNSDDDTNITLQKFGGAIRYIRTDRNIGVAARNYGLEAADGEVIVTLDDDISNLSDDAIKKIILLFNDNEEMAALNFRVVDSKYGSIINWVHHREIEKFCYKTFDTYEITEGAVAFRKRFLELAGLYPTYFFISHEGVDLAFRIMDRGYKVIYCGDIRVEHSTAGAGRASWRRYYYDTRNQFLVSMRNFPANYAARYLVRGLIAMLVYSVRDGYFSYYLRGIKDGLRDSYKNRDDRKVLAAGTMKRIYKMDKERPSVLYMLKKRIFQRGIRI